MRFGRSIRTSKLVAVGNVGPWDETMLAKCADHMNFLSEHIYVKEKTAVHGARGTACG